MWWYLLFVCCKMNIISLPADFFVMASGSDWTGDDIGSHFPLNTNMVEMLFIIY